MAPAPFHALSASSSVCSSGFDPGKPDRSRESSIETLAESNIPPAPTHQTSSTVCRQKSVLSQKYSTGKSVANPVRNARWMHGVVRVLPEDSVRSLRPRSGRPKRRVTGHGAPTVRAELYGPGIEEHLESFDHRRKPLRAASYDGGAQEPAEDFDPPQKKQR